MDVTPGLPTQITTPATISDFDPLLVGDRETSSSKPSNPRGFTSWFNARANIVPQVEELAIFEKARADAEPIPAQRVNLNDVLRRLIQLLKLHRNVYYRREANRERKEHAPISILITTLATSAYEYHATTNQFSSTLDLMLSVIDDMPAFIDFRNDEYHVDNPSMMAGDDGENFADKWNKPDVGRHRRQEFVRWHNNVKDTLKLLFEERDPAVIRNSAAEAFGSYAIAPANSLITALGLHQAIGSLDVLDQFNSTNPTSPAPAPKVTPHA